MSERPVALVTGAARRLGAVTARALHAAGYAIAIHHLSSAAEAEALAAHCNAEVAGSAAVHRADLAEADAPARLVADVEARWGRLDLLVNNASVFDATPHGSLTPALWERIQAVNLRAPLFLALACAPLLAARHGSIVNITDIHAERPRHDYTAYCASKAGLVAVTRGLALDLAPAVRVNAVAPGAILWAASEDATVQADTVRGTPLRRRGDPEDIAEAVCYLARARFVTGHVLNVDGGRLLHS